MPAGIATSGVESTARQAFSHGHEQLFVTEATTDLNATAHDNSLQTIVPRLGRLVTTGLLLGDLAT